MSFHRAMKAGARRKLRKEMIVLFYVMVFKNERRDRPEFDLQEMEEKGNN